MALTLADVDKIARLSRLHLSSEEKEKSLQELNDIFSMVEQMQNINTDGIEPMAQTSEDCAILILLLYTSAEDDDNTPE